MQIRPVSRRTFVKSSLATGAMLSIIPSHVLSKNKPSDKLDMAFIGLGSMGQVNLDECAGENIVALCDVDLENAAPAFEKYPKAKVYQDYRTMLDKHKNIDAVVIATPDHNHAVITMECMKRGIHVYCQKPLTHTLHEARAIAEAAKKYKVQTQMGNQGHSFQTMQILKEWLDDGAIGEVTRIDTWTTVSIPGGKWAREYFNTPQSESYNIPPKMDWDLWLGPASYRPYHPHYHPHQWRSWIDFGTAALGDMGCHTIDPAYWALELGAPESVQATSTLWPDDIGSQIYPQASIVRYNFPARGNRPPVELNWYDGNLLPPRPEALEPERRFPWVGGAFLYGSKGVIMHSSHGAENVRIIPESKMREYTTPPKTLPRVEGTHMDDWIRACKDGKPAGSNFEYSGRLTELILLGVLAIRLNTVNLEWNSPEQGFCNSKNDILKWDTNNLCFINNEQANELLRTEYRQGWSL